MVNAQHLAHLRLYITDKNIFTLYKSQKAKKLLTKPQQFYLIEKQSKAERCFSLTILIHFGPISTIRRIKVNFTSGIFHFHEQFEKPNPLVHCCTVHVSLLS